MQARFYARIDGRVFPAKLLFEQKGKPFLSAVRVASKRRSQQMCSANAG